MTSRRRLLTALAGGQPDRLPATTHHVMNTYLESCLPGTSQLGFFDRFGLDAILWTVPHRHDPARGEYPDPLQGTPRFLESRRVAADSWRIFPEDISRQGRRLVRYRFVTPRGELTTVIEDAGYTSWVLEPLVKKKADIEPIGQWATAPLSDVDAVNQAAEAFGERGIVRGHICCFDVFGQPGCWQDACCLAGSQNLIMAAADDPEWVDEFLGVLQRRKLAFVESLAGARYDVLELGGGDGSASVISPRMFERFVARYDDPLIAAAHHAGQRIVYHLCGRIMPVLNLALAMEPDAIETFTPPGMGGDANLARAKAATAGRAAMIGGFDQFHFFVGCSAEETRAEVRRCFREAGGEGGYILSPSDHFFQAEDELLEAFGREAADCVY